MEPVGSEKTFFKNWRIRAIFSKIILQQQGMVGTNICKIQYLEDGDIKRKPISLLPDGHPNVKSVQKAGLVLS
jgi:hypothetical protein